MTTYESFKNNKYYIDSIITVGFEEIFSNKTTKNIKGKNGIKKQFLKTTLIIKIFFKISQPFKINFHFLFVIQEYQSLKIIKIAYIFLVTIFY